MKKFPSYTFLLIRIPDLTIQSTIFLYPGVIYDRTHTVLTVWKNADQISGRVATRNRLNQTLKQTGRQVRFEYIPAGINYGKNH